MVSHSNLGAGSTRLALDFGVPRCGFADCVVAAEANLWGVWELAFTERGGIQQAAPNIACGMLRNASHGLTRNRR